MGLCDVANRVSAGVVTLSGEVSTAALRAILGVRAA